MEDKLIKNLEKAVFRILQAVENKERIILYGDSDPDGAASVVILEEVLEFLGNSPCQIYFPNRDELGRGLNIKALNYFSKKTPGLLILMDCGITSLKEVKIANKMGFEVIIIDHHQCLSSLPPAKIIVNPRQKGDKYPFKELSNAGLTYKLVKLLLSEAGKIYPLESLLELAMIATLADLMVITDENKNIVEEGVLALGYTERIGLKSLMEITDLNILGVEEIQQKMIPILNVGVSKNHLNETYLLFIEKSAQKAKRLVNALIKRRGLNQEIFQDILEEINFNFIETNSPIIFIGDSKWPSFVLGKIASILSCQHKKPTFVFNKGIKISRGSVRTPKGVDGVKAMVFAKEFLEHFGGHPQAGGFTIKNENIEEFEQCLIKYFS